MARVRHKKRPKGPGRFIFRTHGPRSTRRGPAYLKERKVNPSRFFRDPKHLPRSP